MTPHQSDPSALFQAKTNLAVLLFRKGNYEQAKDLLKKSSLYLKKTHYNRYISNDMTYETILRANTDVYFVNGKTFTWLRKAPPNSRGINFKDVYYYKPQHMI